MNAIYLGKKATLDNALDALGDARNDWIKNDRVSAAIRRAIAEIQVARGRAAEDANRAAGMQLTIR